MDNKQFDFGQALRPAEGPFGLLMDGLKTVDIDRLNELDHTKICVATMILEGSLQEVAIQEEKLEAIGVFFQGIPAGEQNGKRGYQLTFVNAYIRVSY